VAARLEGLSFFFPALNEEDNVAPIVDEALGVLPRFADDLEITIVDDGSSDRTGTIADDLARKDRRVRVIHHGTRRGYGGAVRSGLRSATKNWIFFTDGDKQFDVAELSTFVPEMHDSADMVIGWRRQRADPPMRLLNAYGWKMLVNALFGYTARDIDCAFKLFRREVFERVPLERVRSNGAFFSPEMLITLGRAGIRINQIGVRHFPRTAHEPKGAPPRVILRAIRDLIRLRARLWLHPKD